MAYEISSGQVSSGIRFCYNSIYVYNGGTVNDTTVSNYFKVIVYSGGTANSTTVNSDGFLFVYSGGTANSTTVNSRGSMYVYGTANDTTVNSYGKLYVVSGASALAIKENGGYVEVADGASATFAANSFSNLVLSNAYATVHSGTTANDTTVNSGRMDVYSGGSANSTTVNNGGLMQVYSGGTALAIKENGGCVEVADGANATFVANSLSGLVLSYGQSATLHSGTTANSTTVNYGGNLYVSSGGTANDTVVNSHGYMYVSSGGTASDTVVNGHGSLIVSSGGTANYTTVSWVGVKMTVLSGGTANDTVVNSHGYMYVSSGGTANDTTVNGYGSLIVSSGGTANQTTVNNGWMEISSGGTANYKTVNNGGLMPVYSGGTANWTTVNRFGNLYVSSGGAAYDVTVFADGRLGRFSWKEDRHFDKIGNSSEVVAENIIIVGDEMRVYSGGTANDTIVNYSGNLYVSSGGTANATTVNSEGYLYGSTGGTAHDTPVDWSGRMHVSSSGVANDTTVYGGMYVSSGGTANDTSVNDWGDLYVSSGGTANSTTVNGGGNLYGSSGGTANSTTVQGGNWDYEGHMYVSPGGTANQTTVNSRGFLFVSSGGTADSIDLHSGGYLRLYAGATVKGNVNVGGDVPVWNAGNSMTEDVIRAYDANINFTLNERKSTDDAIISNLGMITGATYFATVSANQRDGTYKLAEGATDFTGSVTVKNTTNQNLGNLRINDSVTVKGTTYKLLKNDSLLSLSVSGNPITSVEVLSVNADITAPTSGSVTVTATFSTDSAKKQYSTDNKTWKTYTTGIKLSKNGTVYFRGIDAAGNVSEVTSYTVSNITSAAPEPEPVKPTVTDLSASGKAEPGTEAIFTPKLAASGVYTVSGSFDGKKGTVTVVDNATGKKVGSGTVKNGVVTFKKELLLDNANSYAVIVKNTDKKSGAAAYSVKLTATELFTKGDNSDDTKAKAQTLAAGTPANDWVGYGDAVDYWKLGVDAQGGFYDLSISGVRNNVKLTVYDRNGKKIKGVSASAKKPAIALANLCLANGSYAVVEAPKAAKAQNSDYKLTLTQKATFTGAKNNDWSQAEVLSKGDTFTGTLTKAPGGDTVDYCDVSKIDTLYFDMTAGKTKVSFFDKNKQAVKVAEVEMANGSVKKNASSLTLAAGNATTDHFTIAAIDDAVKYLKIEASGKTLNGYTITKIA